jgi:hypothetical protein
MPSKAEKARRKAMQRDVSQREHAQAVADMPLTKTDLAALFDYVDTKLEESACDHTLRYTREFLVSRQLLEEQVVLWLAQYGGYCDCEVLANVEDRLG